MSELSELLELFYGAHASFRTARGQLRTVHDSELSSRAIRRQMEARGKARQATLYAFTAPGEEPPARVETVTRFWLERPDRVREEHTSSHPHGRNGQVAVRDGDSWWQYDPLSGAVTNDDDRSVTTGTGQELEQLLDPAYLLASYKLELRGELEAAGRPALAVRATTRPSHTQMVHSFVLEEEAALIVDRERGVLLRRAAVFEGEEMAVAELLDVSWDEEFPRDTFRLELPEGESFRNLREDFARETSLDEAVRRASFPVFVVSRLPEGRWRMHVHYTRSRDRPPTNESLIIHYARDDARRQFSLHQIPRGGEASAVAAHEPNLETIERGGERYIVFRPQEDLLGMQAQVLWNRDETSLHLTSQDLELEELLDLASSLVRA